MYKSYNIMVYTYYKTTIMSNNKFYSSLLVEANEPIDERLIVPTLADLLTISYTYENMVVFVRDQKTFYNLRDGASGTSSGDWQVVGSSSGSFVEWNSGTSYQRGETVYVGSVGELFYIALQPNTNSDPTSNPSDWYSLNVTVNAIKINYIITDNTVVEGDVGRIFELDYSPLGGEYPVIESWMDVWDTNISSARRILIEPNIELNRNTADVISPNTVRVEFLGKIDDIYSVDTNTSEIKGHITIR